MNRIRVLRLVSAACLLGVLLLLMLGLAFSKMTPVIAAPVTTTDFAPGSAQPSAGDQADSLAPAAPCPTPTVYPWLYYTPTIISQIGQSGLVSIGDGVSIDDTGTVAFVGQLSGGNGLFVGDGASPVRNINPAFSANPSRDFGAAVQINNAGRVVARDRVSGSPSRSFVRLWDATVANAYTLIASGGGTSDPYNQVLGPPTVNNNSQVAFAALRNNTEERLVTYTSATPTPLPSTLLPFPIRPMMADDGQVVVQATTASISEIRLYTSTLASYQTIAVTGTDWWTLGNRPGISDDGQIVAFYGDLTATGAIGLNNQQSTLTYPGGTTFQPNRLSSGPGIFVSVNTSAGRIIQRVAGFWDGFSSFDAFSRVGVNATQGNQRAVTIVYVAYENSIPTPKKGLYTQRLEFFGTGKHAFNPIEPGSLAVISSTLVTRQDQTIAGLPGTIQDLRLYDPVNNRDLGDVAFWVNTSTGAQAVIRARPQEVVYLDFNPVSCYRPAPYAQVIFNKLHVTARWYGNMGLVFATQAPTRTELITNIVTIQNAIVDRVQAMFGDVDPAAPGNQGVNVRVLGHVGEAPPVDGPFIRVYVGDSPFSGANPGAVAGGSWSSAFHRKATILRQNRFVYAQVTPLVFVDNIFRTASRYFTDEQLPTSHVISLNDTGPFQITVAQIENAIAGTIAHEVGHTLGPAHLDNNLNTLIMNAKISSPLTDGFPVDELRYPQFFTNNPQLLNPKEFPAGELENSSARLAFAVGSNVAPTQLTREPPGAAVLANQKEIMFRLGASSGISSTATAPSIPNPGSVVVADAMLAIVPGGQHDALPELIDLGAGNLLTLLNSYIPAGEHDQILLVASTSGNGVDIFGTTHGFTGDAGAIDLTDGLLIMTDSRLRGDLVDEAGLPVAASLDLYQTTMTGTVQIGQIGVQQIVTAPLQTIVISPTVPVMEAGSTQQFAAIGTFEDGSTGDMTAMASWSISDTTIATISEGGLVTAQNVGNTTITAFVDGIRGSGVLTVTPDSSLAVTLAMFDATARADHVLVAWETVSEIATDGFNLYRSTDADWGSALLITHVPSQAPGSAQGASYAFQDFGVAAGQTASYWLEDIDLSGTATMHGPVSVTMQAPTAVTLSQLEAAGRRSSAAAFIVLAMLLLTAFVGLVAQTGPFFRERSSLDREV